MEPGVDIHQSNLRARAYVPSLSFAAAFQLIARMYRSILWGGHY